MKQVFFVFLLATFTLAGYSQNVGIGTTTPSTKLEVKSSTSHAMQVGGITNMYVSLYEDNLYRGYFGSYAGNAEDVDFGTGATNTTGRLHFTIQASPKLTIHPNGNVSIGSTILSQNMLFIENTNNSTGLYTRSTGNGTGQLFGINGITFQSANGAGIYGTAADASLFTSGYETGRYGMLGTIGDSGTAVGAFALKGTAVRAKANTLGTALHTTGTLLLQGIEEAAGKVLTSDASGKAVWKKLQSDSTFYRSGDTIYSYPNQQVRIGQHNNYFITGYLSNYAKLVLQDTSLGTFTHNLQSIRVNKDFNSFSYFPQNADISSYSDFRDSNYLYSNSFAGGAFDMQTTTLIPGTASSYGVLARGYSFAGGATGGFFLGSSGDSSVTTGTPFFFDPGTYGIKAQSSGWGAINRSIIYGVYSRTDSGGLGRKYAGYFEVNGNGAGNDTALKWAGFFNGNVAYTGTLSFASDERLKKNIQPLSNALSLINQLKPAQYEFDALAAPQMQMPKGKQFGLLAREVEKVMPQLVNTNVIPAGYKMKQNGENERISDEFTYKGVNYIELIPLLIKGMQEQQKLIEELKEELARLKK